MQFNKKHLLFIGLITLLLSLVTVFKTIRTETSENIPSHPIRRCISPLALVRQGNFFGFFTAPFFPLGKSLTLLNLTSCALLVIFYVKQRQYFPAIRVKVFLAYLACSISSYLVTHILLTVISIYIFNSHSLIVSHLYHDCSSGIMFLVVPAIVLILYIKLYSNHWSTPVLRTVGLCFVLLLWEVYLTPGHGFPILGLCMSSTAFANLFIVPDADVNVNISSVNNSFKGRQFLTLLCFMVIIISIREMSIVQSRKINNRETKPIPKIAIGILSVNRSGNPRYLLTTLESILAELPLPQSGQPTNVKIFSISFTEPGVDDIVFESTKKLMNANPKSREYVQHINGTEVMDAFIRDGGNYSKIIKNANRTKVHLHVATALHFLSLNASWADWIMIHEDDFPLCKSHWKWFAHTLNIITPTETDNYCGFFVATGGAGIVIRNLREVVPSIVDALLDQNLHLASDQIMQKCLRGRLDAYCEPCKRRGYSGTSGLLISSHLIFGHIGFVSSMGHVYNETAPRWTCGWLHPFNGDPDVDVVHTDTYL